MHLEIQGIHEKDGPWYVVEHKVVNAKGRTVVSLGRTNWADWCHDRDLVFTRQGSLYRLGFQNDATIKPLDQAQQLIDLTADRFEQIAPPIGVDTWNGKLTVRRVGSSLG